MARHLIYRGAEADLYRGMWHNLPAVYKHRKPKPYRHRQLDTRLRAQRTLHEAQMLHRARLAGVPTPLLYDLDPRRCELVLQYIPGPTLAQHLQAEARGVPLAAQWGQLLGRLHTHHLIHGDPNPTNFIPQPPRLIALDFGLAYHSHRPEDYATDLHLARTLLRSTHPPRAPTLWHALQTGYRQCIPADQLRLIQRQLTDIARRGRYARLT